jgi:hypothetical protein
MKSGHFEFRKALGKNPIFGVKMLIKRFSSTFDYICKDFKMNFFHIFYHQKNPLKKCVIQNMV